MQRAKFWVKWGNVSCTCHTVDFCPLSVHPYYCGLIQTPWVRVINLGPSTNDSGPLNHHRSISCGAGHGLLSSSELTLLDMWCWQGSGVSLWLAPEPATNVSGILEGPLAQTAQNQKLEGPFQTAKKPGPSWSPWRPPVPVLLSPWAGGGHAAAREGLV